MPVKLHCISKASIDNKMPVTLYYSGVFAKAIAGWGGYRCETQFSSTAGIVLQQLQVLIKQPQLLVIRTAVTEL